MLLKIYKDCKGVNNIVIHNESEVFDSHLNSKKYLLINLINKLSDEDILDNIILDLRYNMEIMYAAYEDCRECGKENPYEEFRL